MNGFVLLVVVGFCALAVGVWCGAVGMPRLKVWAARQAAWVLTAALREFGQMPEQERRRVIAFLAAAYA
ncbi:MAG: hypothetical protein ACPLRM_08325, partial [Anaerolineae bacterium]